MPNVWTHLIFGAHVLGELGEARILRNEELKRIFNMGCQGPDFLFYHHFLPWKKGKAMNRLGSEMHSRHCGNVIMDLLDAVSGRRAHTSSPDPAIVYAIGFVLHHILDRNMHPYIFSRSGFRKWDHQRFEVMLDTLMVAKHLQKETWRTPVWHEINIGRQLPEGIVDAFEQITACHYPELAGQVVWEDWNEACFDMIRAQRLFHDPTGIRRLLTFGKIEAMVYKRSVPPLDILNESCASWIDPTDRTIHHNDSVDMLWSEAIEDGKRTITAILHWLRTEESKRSQTAADSLNSMALASEHRAKSAALVGNRSYEHGLNCDDNIVIRYAQPIWPDGGLAEPDHRSVQSSV